MHMFMSAMQEDNIDRCAFPFWYPLFRTHTFKSLIIPLEEEFVHYLQADGIVLPKSVRSEHNTNDSGFSDEEAWSDDEACM